MNLGFLGILRDVLDLELAAIGAIAGNESLHILDPACTRLMITVDEKHQLMSHPICIMRPARTAFGQIALTA